MKTIKYLALAAVALATTCSFYSCSDDDSLGEAPRLFSPIPTLNSQKNNLLVTWNNINGATEYELTAITTTRRYRLSLPNPRRECLPRIPSRV